MKICKRTGQNLNAKSINAKLSALIKYNELMQPDNIVISKADLIKVQAEIISPTNITKKEVEEFRQRVLQSEGCSAKRNYAIVTIMAYSYYGGLGTGKCANVNEFEKYAVTVEELSIPEQTKIVALGEATHGNKEFQQLKLDIFKIMVEDYGVRAFSLEGDYGGCEAVNRYIHGGEGTVKDAVSAIGFAIYRTEEMENLI